MPKGTKIELTAAEVAAKEAEKASNFVKLAEARTNKALAAIAQLRALGGKAYVSTEAQRDAIGKALEAEVIKAMNALNGTAAATGGFSLAAPATAPTA